MGDPRVAKLARVLVRYSVGVKAGDLFQINAPALAAPLIRELYREALEVGAYPFTRIGIDGLNALLYKHGSDAQIGHISPLARHETEQISATISIMAAENTKSLSGADPQKVALRSQAIAILSDL